MSNKEHEAILEKAEEVEKQFDFMRENLLNAINYNKLRLDFQTSAYAKTLGLTPSGYNKMMRRKAFTLKPVLMFCYVYGFDLDTAILKGAVQSTSALLNASNEEIKREALRMRADSAAQEMGNIFSALQDDELETIKNALLSIESGDSVKSRLINSGFDKVIKCRNELKEFDRVADKKNTTKSNEEESDE